MFQMSDIRKAVETSHIKVSGLSILKKNGPIILKRLNKPPTAAHTLSNQTIRAVNPKSNETLKLIPINITPTSTVLTNSQSNYLPVMNPVTFKTYMDAKKMSVPVSICNTSTSSSLTKPATLTPVAMSKHSTFGPVNKTTTLTSVTISSNLTPTSMVNNLTTTYSSIKPNTFTSLKPGTLTAIKPSTSNPATKTSTLTSLSPINNKPNPNVISTNSSPLKIVKVMSNSTLLKQKEILPGPQFAIKLKNAAAYNEMLKSEKLRQLYKCMGRDCAYTTDDVENFQRHFEIHATTCDINNSTVPYDFKKCAYCYSALGNWCQMEQHYEEKHAYCEFQCSYCFYRAISQSYVEIHQVRNFQEYIFSSI